MQSPIQKQAALPSRVRVLAICAHPDDIESWCGGTLALLVERGCEVRLAVCTAGEKGSDDRRLTTAAVAETRISEQRAAAARLGISAVRFLDGKDGELEDTLPFRAQIVRLLREFQPACVFTHDPERPYPPYTSHRDHRVVGRAVLDAAGDAGNRWIFPELTERGLQPWDGVRWVAVAGSATPTHAADASAGLERAVASLLEHRAYIEALTDEEPETYVRGFLTEVARSVGERFGGTPAVAFELFAR